MSKLGEIERKTQNRVVALFRDKLKYSYVGNWEDRPDNSNIEEALLTPYLTKCGYTEAQISRAISSCMKVLPRPKAAKIAALPLWTAQRTMAA